MKLKSFFLLTGILFLGLFFRLYGVNWDQGFHLHPDERFLTLVGAKETVPSSFSQYLDPSDSPLNPTVLGFPFFVYGVLPITLNFFLTLFFHTQSYDLFTLQGRVLAAIFDSGSVIIVFLTAWIFEKKEKFLGKMKFFAALFYAVAVLPIQLAHFFTVDIFLSFFVLLSFYFSVLATIKKPIIFSIFSAIALGLAISCKITALAIVPLELFLFTTTLFKQKTSRGKTVSIFVLFTVGAYLTTRIADPYLFTSSNIFDLRINPVFLQSIKTLFYYNNPDLWYPPNVQWVSKIPVIFSLTNLAVFGLGIGMFAFCVFGIVTAIKKKRVYLLAVTVWVILLFLYQSIAYVKTMRYFIIIYPFLTIFAAIGFSQFIQKRNILLIVGGSLLIILWPVAFLSIYTKPHTRVTASNWIYKHIPSGSIILGEYWDDPLPLPIANETKQYTIVLMHVFDYDTPQKWEMMNKQLQIGQYLVLSSNRGWGSIPTDPKHYQLMGKWYKDLFAGKLAYKEIAQFTSYPSLTYLGIPLIIPDDNAEEAFTVFDHPKVMVFKRMP